MSAFFVVASTLVALARTLEFLKGDSLTKSG
jgi:hypothetical protein